MDSRSNNQPTIKRFKDKITWDDKFLAESSLETYRYVEIKLNIKGIQD